MAGSAPSSTCSWTTSAGSCAAKPSATGWTRGRDSASGRVGWMGERVVEVRDLRKTYGEVEAVRGISFHVGRGEVFAMLGPNGAGKTTTTEILEGYRTRSAGDVTVLGHDPAKRERALKERVGIVLQSTGIDPFLTVTETIEMYAGYYPSRRPTDEVIDVVGLAEKRDTRVNKLSGGQQRRLDVAIALAGDPELLFLDEPTTGFDPGARRLADGSCELQVEANETTKTVHDLTGWALDHGLELEALEITLPTLEDVYLQLTGSEVGT